MSALSPYINSSVLDAALEILAAAGEVKEGTDEREKVAIKMIEAVVKGMDSKEITHREVRYVML